MRTTEVDTPTPGGKEWTYQEVREIHVDASRPVAFVPIRRIGGIEGWYYLDWLWRLRGGIDRIVGGPGLSRGRRSQNELKVGDVLDCWRVGSYEPDRLLRLELEMRSGGKGQLEFEVRDNGNGNGCIIRQTASFKPSGFFGRLYWYGSYPLHLVIFPGMLNGIAARIREPGAH